MVEAFGAQVSELELAKYESAACRERVARLEAEAAQAAKEAVGKTELAAVRAEMRHLMQMVAGAIGAGTMHDKNYSEQKRQ